ncbi:MAG: hypothetical protein C4542_09800 [Dehalococcoidia bacterium]|nr:MAG: hypothetical protein C4542_09800 [Dehalococcoidia bacterium]
MSEVWLTVMAILLAAISIMFIAYLVADLIRNTQDYRRNRREHEALAARYAQRRLYIVRYYGGIDLLAGGRVTFLDVIGERLDYRRVACSFTEYTVALVECEEGRVDELRHVHGVEMVTPATDGYFLDHTRHITITDNGTRWTESTPV